ncbi:MAG: RNA polymerase sigma factor, partial [Pirellulaceae bacterium]
VQVYFDIGNVVRWGWPEHWPRWPLQPVAEPLVAFHIAQDHRLKRDHYEEGRKFRPWLYTIATNQAIDAQRRNRRHRMVSLDRAGADHVEEVGRLADVLVSNAPDPVDVAADKERSAWVRSALADLSDQARQVVELVYYRGMKYREAAEILAVPVGTVKSRLHAAINKLNDSMAHQEAERRG